MSKTCRTSLIVAIISLPLLSACSKAADAPSSAPAAGTNAPQPAKQLAACELVTAAEMSAIFGKPMTAESVDSSLGQGACKYSAPGGITPSVELQVERGGAEAQAVAAGLLNRAETGMANRFEGIGDSAVSIGPMLYIRRHEDLVSLMIFGADDTVVAAKRIYAIASSRLPALNPSTLAPDASKKEASQALADAVAQFAPPSSETSGLADFARALGSLSGESAVASLPVDPRSEDPRPTGAAPTGSAIPLDSAEHIPLIPGLIVTGAVSDPDGDYEPILEVSAVRGASYDVVYSGAAPAFGKQRPISIARRVRNDDQRASRTMRDWFIKGDADEYPGTVPQMSSAMIDDLRRSGMTPFTRISANADPFAFDMLTRTGTLKRVEDDPVEVEVLVNGRLDKLPAIHAVGALSGEGRTNVAVELWVLDDRVNPIVLEYREGKSHSRVVKIEYPIASRAAEIERALENGETVEVYGIYFDFGSATMRPQSQPVLEEIAGILRRHESWSLDLAGFTDSIGNDSANLELSRRRTDAVKSELTSRYSISSDRLNTAGHGEASPKATNDTPAGRAQNRRVEITRRRGAP